MSTVYMLGLALAVLLATYLLLALLRAERF